MIDLRSDNVSGVAPQILAAISSANPGTALGYGADDFTARLRTRLSEVFEHELEVFPVVSGTAANALSLAAVTRAWGAVYCHQSAHVHNTECGATEFFTGGAKLLPLDGEQFKIGLPQLETALAEAGFGLPQRAQPCALSLTQATDFGTVYRPEEVAALAAAAHRRGLAVHMDGARLANSLAAVQCMPSEMTWRAGVDVLSLGATKNGTMNADAIVTFKPDIAAELRFRCRRGGHVPSKMRFLSAQLIAYLEDSLWLRLAARANHAASVIAAGLKDVPGLELVAPVDVNEIFLRGADEIFAQAEQRGLLFYRRPRRMVRLVTSFQTSEADARACVEALRSSSSGGPA
jgi:threonine aldolase